ncbi:hypothetical protein, partial [Streptococcus oralis]|uniref:hypothetical protein n=1 Tax=Streptococcus oralis TaxID=1303 RepID=UPI000B159537
QMLKQGAIVLEQLRLYEAMDKVGAKLEALNIQKYKTTNKIGYKRIESVKDPYGHPVGTKEVTPPEIG